MRITLSLLFLTFIIFDVVGQDTKIVIADIGTSASSKDSTIEISLIRRFQSANTKPKSKFDQYDNSIYSPKSVVVLDAKNKFYINSLEGFTTSVYDLDSFERLSVIRHNFKDDDAHLFQDTSVFDYKFRYRKNAFNIFKGKPVEFTFSHEGKYLWVTYYRRDYDTNAVSPSAVAIIDTDSDEIVRVMPTGPLPKMISASKDNKYVAVTHWGDNTVGLIDISSGSPSEFEYVKHLVVGKKMSLDFNKDEKVNRDVGCGYCLRGTVFSEDSKTLLVGRMGGGGIALFDMDDLSYDGTVFGMQTNIRHLVVKDSTLYISTNKTGYVQKTNINDLIDNKKISKGSNTTYKEWASKFIGVGVRTISVTSDQRYVFAAVNNESKIVVLDAVKMKILTEIPADSFPVGMDISGDDRYLFVTAQGKYKRGGGNSVMVYEINYND